LCRYEWVEPGRFRDYASLPVRRPFVFAPLVAGGSEQQRVELIGPVDGLGGDGPSNGMYALQRELRARIAPGLDWLTIKSLPASRNAIPWFWNWADRRYAAWWDSEGLPFIQAPNMLFINSGTSRIDAEECALLDASNCRAMFCHTPWYSDLLRKHRGPANPSPNVTSLYSVRRKVTCDCMSTLLSRDYRGAVHPASKKATVRQRIDEAAAQMDLRNRVTRCWLPPCPYPS
jgi:hypothetical protein